MEEENSEGANNIFDEEINTDLENLIGTMSGIQNIEHERTLHACYSEYFHQKVTEFENVDQQIELLSQLFITKSNDLPALEIAEERNVVLRNIRASFDCIKTEGFGLENLFNSSMQISQSYDTNESQTMQIVQSYETIESQTNNGDIQMKPKNGDNFCDFVLKDLDKNCDNETEMIGYGAATPGNVQNSPLIVTSEAGNSNQPSSSNSNMPPRLRFKRRFLPEEETESKRKQTNNNE